MAIDVFIYSGKSSSALQQEGRQGLEDDLESFLGDAGGVTGGGTGSRGWNIDVALNDAADSEEWLPRIAEFLRRWGVPDDTFLVVRVDESSEGRRLPVFGSGAI